MVSFSNALGTSKLLLYKLKLSSSLQDFQRYLGVSSLPEHRPNPNDKVNVVARYILDSVLPAIIVPIEARIV